MLPHAAVSSTMTVLIEPHLAGATSFTPVTTIEQEVVTRSPHVAGARIGSAAAQKCVER